MTPSHVARRLALGISLVGAATLLSGCGGGGGGGGGGDGSETTTSTTPRPHIDCSTFNEPKPAFPANVMEYNGKAWPPACFDETKAHFFVIGDWGGLCNWVDNECKPDVQADLGKGMPLGDAGMPLPMPNRKGNHYSKLEPVIQRMVKDRMVDRTKELQKLGTPPKFVVNVGDNFYPGGIDTHCGADAPGPSVHSRQFEQIWDEFYPAKDLENMEWWSVLGNHDYGGVCFIKGWDKQIEKTWNSTRWVMPAQFWSRRVHFANFKVDYWFLDGNVFDIMMSDPEHSPCTPTQNPGPYCDKTKYPPRDPLSKGDSCPVTGPSDPGACRQWFLDLWNKQYDWLTEAVSKSDADWQIIVNHYPATFDTGIAGRSHIHWGTWLEANGIDMMISGHTHQQEVHYKEIVGGVDFGKAAWVISGGGGGVSSELYPSDSGEDDAYGFMDMEISLETIKVTAYSHGGIGEKLIIRNQTTVYPISRKEIANKVVV